MSKEIDKLKEMAAPNSERIAVAVEELIKEQIITNNLLVALCDSNDIIVTYKEQQKQGDIKFRKKSTTLSLFGIGIALVALYISVAGYGEFARDVVLCLDWIKDLL